MVGCCVMAALMKKINIQNFMPLSAVLLVQSCPIIQTIFLKGLQHLLLHFLKLPNKPVYRILQGHLMLDSYMMVPLLFQERLKVEAHRCQ